MGNPTENQQILHLDRLALVSHMIRDCFGENYITTLCLQLVAEPRGYCKSCVCGQPFIHIEFLYLIQ